MHLDIYISDQVYVHIVLDINILKMIRMVIIMYIIR